MTNRAERNIIKDEDECDVTKMDSSSKDLGSNSDCGDFGAHNFNAHEKLKEHACHVCQKTFTAIHNPDSIRRYMPLGASWLILGVW